MAKNLYLTAKGQGKALLPHIKSRPITNGEFLEFINDGGYQRPELWLSDGWSAVRNLDWQSPLYWKKVDGTWKAFTLAGLKPIIFDAPVCHVSHFEADHARWTGNRLPTEAEWEHEDKKDRRQLCGKRSIFVQHIQMASLNCMETSGNGQQVHMYHFKTAEGAVGEYNGKFMSRWSFGEGLVSHPRAISGVLIEISFTLRTVGSSVGSD